MLLHLWYNFSGNELIGPKHLQKALDQNINNSKN